MTWTRHGHHIPGSTTQDELALSSRARCGGPHLCKQCDEDFAVYLAGRRVMENQNNEPDPYETSEPHVYGQVTRESKAMKVSGRNADAVAAWTGGEVRYYETGDAKGVAGVVIPTLVAPEFVEVGKYVVQNERGQFTSVEGAAFEQGHSAPIDIEQHNAVALPPAYLDVEDQIRRRAMLAHPSARSEDPNYPNGPLNYETNEPENDRYGHANQYERSADSGPNGSWPEGYKRNVPRLGQ